MLRASSLGLIRRCTPLPSPACQPQSALLATTCTAAHIFSHSQLHVLRRNRHATACQTDGFTRELPPHVADASTPEALPLSEGVSESQTQANSSREEPISHGASPHFFSSREHSLRDQPPHAAPGLGERSTDEVPKLEDTLDDMNAWEIEEIPNIAKQPLKHRHSVPPPVDESPFLDSSEGLPVPLPDLAHENQQLAQYANRPRLHAILANTRSLSEAWEAYHTLRTLHPNSIYPQYLHRLARMLATSRPQTRGVFLRLLSVLSTLHRSGGKVRIQEWNALITYAGKGYRYLRAQDYQNALDVYEDLIRGLPPGTTLAARRPDEDAAAEFDPSVSQQLDDGEPSVPTNKHAVPDIATFTTLLDIAARTKQPPAVRHATNLLTNSGLVPTRITHLILLRYFGRAGDLAGVRDTLFRMQHQGHEIGLDGLNSAMYAFVLSKRIDVASTIYRVMRHNLQPDPSGIGASVEYLRDVEGLVVPEGIIPDAITYTAMVQALAYRGSLTSAVRVFMDMITTTDPTTSVPFEPSLPVYRALFLGFSRHSRGADSDVVRTRGGRKVSEYATEAEEPEEWTYEHLLPIFKSFLLLPHDTRVSNRTIYWILLAFDRATNHDVERMSKVWMLLERRFGGGWGGRIEEMRAQIFSGRHS